MEKKEAIAKLRRAIDKIGSLKQLPDDTPDFRKWKRNTEIAIVHIFGQESRHLSEFNSLDYSPVILTPKTIKIDFLNAYLEGLINAEALLQSMLEEIQEYWPEQLKEDGRSQSKRDVRAFICHSSSDKPTVREIHRRLHADGVNAWLDEEDILPGQDWQQEIKNAIRSSDVVIVCLSHESGTKKGYIQKEIKDVLDEAEQQPEDAIFIIPCKLEDCVVPERLRRWQWVDYFGQNGYERLIRAIKRRADSLGIINTLGSVQPSLYTVRPSDFEVVVLEGHRTTIQHEKDVRRNNNQLSLLVRPGRRVEIEIIRATRREEKNAMTISFTFGGEQYMWNNIVVRLKEFITKHNLNWITFQEFSWGDNWIIHGGHLISYFPEIADVKWLNAEFNPPPTWHSRPRPMSSDPINSSSISFALREP